MAKRTSPKENRDWWSTAEVAEELGTSPRTVLDWTREPELLRVGAVRKAGRFLRVHWPKLQEWLDRKTIEDAGMGAVSGWQPGKPGRPPKWAQHLKGREAG